MVFSDIASPMPFFLNFEFHGPSVSCKPLCKSCFSYLLALFIPWTFFERELWGWVPLGLKVFRRFSYSEFQQFC